MVIFTSSRLSNRDCKERAMVVSLHICILVLSFGLNAELVGDLCLSVAEALEEKLARYQHSKLEFKLQESG
jgi:hypothetical protein